MKTILYSILFFFIIPFTSLSQSCIPEHLVFYTQEEIDNFPINYPNCTEIINNLNIQSSEIYNLDSLYQITAIGGSLSFFTCFDITDISGLENLNFIGGDLKIRSSNLLTELTGLENVLSIGGVISIENNNSLTDISALENIAIESIEEIFILNNPLLSDCNAQSVCDYIAAPTGAVNIHNNAEGCNNPSEIAEQCGNTFECLDYGNYYIVSQNDVDNFQTYYPGCSNLLGNVFIDGDDITNLDGLQNISSIENLLITNNPLLTDISGLENASIDGKLSIYNNPLLSECNILNVCNYLESPNGMISIYSNGENCNSPTQIASVCGVTLNCLPFGNYYFYSQSDIDNFPINYSSCTQLEGDVYIEGDMTNLLGLSDVTQISGLLSILFTPNLQNLEGLGSLTTIGDNFDIGFADSLIDLSGLENLNILNRGIYIYYNENLVSLNGLNNLDTLNYYFYLLRNNSLTDISAISNLNFINCRISIGRHLVLENLSGLENISAVNGILKIYDNDLLNDISALSSLTEGVTSVDISDNDILESLIGLENINSDSMEELIITNNPFLSECAVESVCNYLSSSNGYVNISNNASGCLSEIEVEESCGFLSVEEGKELNLTIYPNPANNELFISNETNIKLEQLIIYNQMGQQVIKQNIVGNRIDISSLHAGVYLIEIRSSLTIKKKIFIKN